MIAGEIAGQMREASPSTKVRDSSAYVSGSPHLSSSERRFSQPCRSCLNQSRQALSPEAGDPTLDDRTS